MPSSIPNKGVNDLATLHPEVAAEADGWDPLTVLPGSSKKMPWKCEKGHTWDAKVVDRTKKNSNCPYCTNRKVLPGFNDLQTVFPEIAAEADGWDPSIILPGNDKKMPWKCKQGHTWDARVYSRTGKGKRGCPYCSNTKVWIGFNDLKTLHPEFAKEADGWDPSKVLAGGQTKMPWKCKKGHAWEVSINSRITYKTGCPYCANKKVSTVPRSRNDLKTRFPEIAAEANGWDPSTVLPGTHKKMPWKCEKGHTWRAVVNSRTSGKGCPYCANQLVWTGFNDLKTLFPDVASEADGWDPSVLLAGSKKRMPWKCKKGHAWKAVIGQRSYVGNGCPYCSNQLVLNGFNDLKTHFPEIAAEANGWDPSTVLPGTHKKMPWKCEKGHTWKAEVHSRTTSDSGCPECAEHGFNPGKPAWFYLLEKPEEQQFGITNNLPRRMQVHGANGWCKVDKTGPHPGQEVLETERKLKDWLKREVGLIPGTHENWFTSKLEVHSLAELKKKSGIETSIF